MSTIETFLDYVRALREEHEDHPVWVLVQASICIISLGCAMVAMLCL